MLSRTARNMYQLGRLVEHAENITRILDVNHRMSLETSYFSDLDVWSPIIAITRSEESFGQLHEEVTETNVYNFLLLSRENPNSALSCIESAREIARTVREHISEEMWVHLNGMYWTLRESSIDQAMDLQSNSFNHQIRMFCNAFHGLVANTMVHGNSWQFLRLGRFLDCALMTSRILEIKYHLLLPSADEVGRPLDLHQWQALLRSVSGFEAYRRLYKAKIVPHLVVRLLLINPTFPRSVHFCLIESLDALKGIGATNQEQFELRREAATFADDLRSGVTEEEIGKLPIKELLENIQQRCEGIAARVESSYFDRLSVVDDRGRQHRMSVQMPQQ